VEPAPAQPPDLDRLIAGLIAAVPEVLHALMVSADGIPLAGATLMADADRADQLAAITSGLISLARAGALIADGGDVIQALVTMERGTLVVMAIGAAASLVVLTTAADLDLVGYEMTMLAEEAARLVGPE
jgi:predicted regulator of Ras-like GTPase activity (Roadblock/LC7/MglB family)